MTASTPGQRPAPANRTLLIVVAWLWVLVPFGYGVWQLLIKVAQLFAG
ncbi:MAG TPA: hypothetical protein VGH99_08850 [Pseudonocardia sp.]|jgi:hypothetical protein